MIVHIHDNLRVADLQERFSKCFSSLKIEFYNRPHCRRQASPDDYMISAAKTLGEIRRKHNEGNLEIKSWYTVERVEREFREKFDLNVQVFRRENASWIQTSRTDKFTLQEQNEMSRHAEVSMYPECPEQFGEYDEL